MIENHAADKWRQLLIKAEAERDQAVHELTLCRRLLDSYEFHQIGIHNGITAMHNEILSLRSHRCEVGLEDPDAMLAHLQTLPPEEIEAINQAMKRK